MAGGPAGPSADTVLARWVKCSARGGTRNRREGGSENPERSRLLPRWEGLSPAFGQPEVCAAAAAGLSSLNPRKSLRNREPFTDANQTFDYRLSLTERTKAASGRGASPGLGFCADYAAGALPARHGGDGAKAGRPAAGGKERGGLGEKRGRRPALIELIRAGDRHGAEVRGCAVAAIGSPPRMREGRGEENGSCRPSLAPLRQAGIRIRFNEPGDPWQNGVNESFDGRFDRTVRSVQRRESGQREHLTDIKSAAKRLLILLTAHRSLELESVRTRSENESPINRQRLD